VFSHDRTHENVAFCLVSHAQVGATTLLVVRRVISLREEDYLRDSGHGAAWSGASMIPAIELAMREDLGIVLVHAHDFPGEARLSSDDLASARRLVPTFVARVPGRPHGSVVLGRGNAAGFVALPGAAPGVVGEIAVRWLGKSIVDWPQHGNQAGSDNEVFDRQALVVGDQNAIATASVAVVGLCGGGSHVVQQLAHVGFGTVIGVDADTSEATNLHRQVGMRPDDAKSKRPKTEIMERLVTSIGTGTRFVAVRERVPEPRALEALRSADVIVGCVDNLHARADLQEIAWRYSIPYIDVGVSIRPSAGKASEPRVTVGGNVLILVPGGFCMWCIGYLSEEKLAQETGGKGRSYFQTKEGEAQVVSFNGVVASQAVSEVFQLFAGFRGNSIDPAALSLSGDRQRGVLKLDGLRGTLDDWGAQRRPNCQCCEWHLGAGSTVWRAA
jgi:hypothetical protein